MEYERVEIRKLPADAGQRLKKMAAKAKMTKSTFLREVMTKLANGELEFEPETKRMVYKKEMFPIAESAYQLMVRLGEVQEKSYLHQIRIEKKIDEL